MEDNLILEEKNGTKNKRPYKRRKKTTTKKTEEIIFKKDNLKIINLGGLLEVGKNLTVFEYKDDIS